MVADHVILQGGRQHHRQYFLALSAPAIHHCVTTSVLFECAFEPHVSALCLILDSKLWRQFSLVALAMIAFVFIYCINMCVYINIYVRACVMYDNLFSALPAPTFL